MDDIELVLDSMSREEKLLVFALGVANDLVDKGLLTGRMPLTDKGSRIYQALVDSGFDPSEAELQACYAQHFKPR